MIGIKLEAEERFLDTTESTSIDLTLENPLLGEGEKLSPGSFSLPFPLPAGDVSPRNAAILGHTDVIENASLYTTKRAELYYQNVLFKSGNIKVKSAIRGTLSSYFLFGLSTVHESFKTASLKEVMSEPVVIDDESISKKLYVKRNDDPDGTWDIIVNGVSYSGSRLAVMSAINADGELTVDTGKPVPYAVPDPGFNTPHGLISPPYITISLVTFVTAFNPITEEWEPFPEPYNDPLEPLSVATAAPDNYLIEVFDMSTYYAGFDSFFATMPSSRLVFPVCFNADAYGELNNIKRGELVNGVNAAGLMRNVCQGAHTPTVNHNSLQPFVRLKHVLDKIAQTFGFEWEGDFYTHSDIDGFIVDNSFSLDSPQQLIEDEIFVFWKRSFNISDLVPDMSVVEFLNALSSRYNLAIYFNEATNKARICFREDIGKAQDVEDITQYCSPIEAVEDLRRTGFSLVVPIDESDALSVEERLNIGTPEEDVVINCGRLHATGSTVLDGGYVEGVRVSRPFGTESGLRIFHYGGLIANGVFSYQSSKISANSIYEALQSAGATQGIYDRFWKYWLMFKKNRRSVTLTANLPFSMLKLIDWELKRRFDRSDFLIKSIKLKLTNKGVLASKIELITMR